MMSTLSRIKSPQETYELELSKARDAFIKRPALLEVLSPDANPVFVELFLIAFNGLGVYMTEPVEQWIRQAGEKCKQSGFVELGDSLCLYANDEAEHHKMMIKDTQTLVAHWNAKHPFKLDAQEMLTQPTPPGVQSYIKLHEDVIASDTPFRQLAIELEIEQLAVDVGPILMKQVTQIVDSDIVKRLSFLKTHIVLDVSHAEFNQKEMDKFLAQYPDMLPPLIDAGKKALETYGAFLEDCVRLAKATASAMN